VHVPHAEMETPRDAKSTHVPVVSPLHAHGPPPSPAWHRRAETHTRPPQSAEEEQFCGGADGTVHASPFTQMLLQTSPEQHAPLGHAWQMASRVQRPQRTTPVSHGVLPLVVLDGHASPVQHALSMGTHASPQWCCPGGQSVLPVVPAPPQQ
jgi:hypothetical protein